MERNLNRISLQTAKGGMEDALLIQMMESKKEDMKYKMVRKRYVGEIMYFE